MMNSLFSIEMGYHLFVVAPLARVVRANPRISGTFESKIAPRLPPPEEL
jgi:hypothetical protein